MQLLTPYRQGLRRNEMNQSTLHSPRNYFGIIGDLGVMIMSESVMTWWGGGLRQFLLCASHGIQKCFRVSQPPG